MWGSLRVVKCRLFAPFAPELRLPYTDHGIDIARLVFETLVATGVVKSNKSWYTIEKEGHPYSGIKFQGTNGYYDLIEKKVLELDMLESLAMGKPLAEASEPALPPPPPPPPPAAESSLLTTDPAAPMDPSVSPEGERGV